MRVIELAVRDFRSYSEARVALGQGVTVIQGANGAGKTNLLEALYFGCTGRSCRAVNERDVVRFGAPGARVAVRSQGEDGPHETAVAFIPGQPKRLWLDGALVDRLLDTPMRPLLSIFLPDRLELIKGPPALRRAHLDQVVGALWPARRQLRQTYAKALAQRNALLGRVRAGLSSRLSLPAWDAELARHGVQLMRARAEATQAIEGVCARLGRTLGLERELRIFYRPRSRARDADELARELAERLERDLAQGFTGHGPHRDELTIELGGHDLRAFGSQGQQRIALLSLLLAEREAIAERRDIRPVMLLDDVTSELDRTLREALMELLMDGGQALITTTDAELVPGATGNDVHRIVIEGGRVLAQAAA